MREITTLLVKIDRAHSIYAVSDEVWKARIFAACDHVFKKLCFLTSGTRVFWETYMLFGDEFLMREFKCRNINECFAKGVIK